jgi:hypothetical protein
MIFQTKYFQKYVICIIFSKERNFQTVLRPHQLKNCLIGKCFINILELDGARMVLEIRLGTKKRIKAPQLMRVDIVQIRT